MLLKKKQVLTATLLIALAAAVAVNWYYSRPTAESTQTTTAQVNLGDTMLVAGSVQNEEATSSEEETTNIQDNVDDSEYFAEAKLKRTNMHDETVEEIEEILENENLSQEDKSKVTSLLTQFKNELQAETDTENLIKAKTAGECLVIINDSSAQVILPKGTLNDSVLIQITEIFEKNTDISAENLTIIETK
ncbi:MAG: SpoIIIAH-like family protein [Acutalibacteraceae bacterium]